MRQSNVFPLILLFGGVCAAIFIAIEAIADLNSRLCLPFAIASLVGVIGWHEVRAGKDFNKSFDGE